MKKNVKLVLLALLIVSFGIVVACGSSSDERDSLPKNAVIVQDHGNGWVEFRLDGRKYLYNRSWEGHYGYMALTQIHDCQCSE